MNDFEEVLSEAVSLANQPDVLSSTFDKQLAFITDPAKLKALFCTRRAAKSYTAGIYMVAQALKYPGSNCYFIALTRDSAEGIIWKDILKVINQQFVIGMDFNQSRLQATFPNGSIIRVLGVDVDEDEMNKLLGKKYRLVCIDEASMFTIDMHKLVYGILKPAAADQRGTICLMGTSSNFTRGLFFDITKGKEQGWSVHRWTAHDNPHVAKQWQEELDEIDKLRPLFKDTPLFKQWYLNEWVVDKDKLVYKFDSEKNIFKSRPKTLSPSGWTYVLGVDLGYEDDTAFVLCAFHENDKILYVLKTFNQKHMDITDVANKIKEFLTHPELAACKVIIDGANKQAVEEITRRHGVPLQAADKTGKSDFIELLNAELIQAKIKIHDALHELIAEMMGLVWKSTGDKIDLPRKEHPNLPNHLCDALLYAWRYCYGYMAEPVKAKVIKGSKEWYTAQADGIWERERERLERDNSDWPELHEFTQDQGHFN
jgi:phage terminase large subunit